VSTPTCSLLVVGDRFGGFSAQDGVVTVSQLRRQLTAGIVAGKGPVLVKAGQGVGTDEWRDLRQHADRLGLGRQLVFCGRPVRLAVQAEVHKKVETNTLIADLERAGGGLFTASLRVHNDNELLLDHQTGQHVQGMVAIEAARQMFLAVSERFYASRYPETKYYYVIESMYTDFENFLFPLGATVEFQTIRAEVDDPTRLSFTAEISIYQAGRRASHTKVVYSGFESSVIELKEHKRGRRAVDYEVGAAAATPVAV
jgi:hypothetical protein